MKLDLCMWTYNSGKYLNATLRSIANAIPQENVCHKIAVDGGSSDSTVTLLRMFAWKVLPCSPPSIPRQANVALNQVDTSIFATFEHDLLIPVNWMAILDNFNRKNVVAATGLRRYVGSKTLAAINSYADEKRRSSWNYSIDNTAFRTDVVKSLGGFPRECPVSSDALLREKIIAAGYTWVVDRSIISQHLRASLVSAIDHTFKQNITARWLWGSHERNRWTKLKVLSLPITGARVAAQYHAPWAFPGYPLMRLPVELLLKMHPEKRRYYSS